MEKAVFGILQGKVIDIAFCGHEDIFYFIQRKKQDIFGRRGLSDEADVNMPFIQKLERMVAGLAFDGNPDVWVKGYEFLQIGQKHIFAQRRAYANPEVPDAKFGHLMELLLSGFQRIKGRAYVLKQKLSFCRELYASGAAGKQRGAQSVFQLPDGFADGGLADVQGCGCPRDIFFLSDGVKYFV